MRGGDGDESPSVTILATPSDVIESRTTEDDFLNSRRAGRSTIEVCEAGMMSTSVVSPWLSLGAVLRRFARYSTRIPVLSCDEGIIWDDGSARA